MTRILPTLRGWSLFVTFVILIAYSAWFAGPGYFGQLAALAPGMPLQSAFFYSGDHAVNVLGGVDPAAHKTVYLAYLFDLPYMILNALVLQGLIAFGAHQMRWKSGFTKACLFFPIAFLVFDIAEDSSLALTLASGSEAIGSLAGIFTLLKMTTFIIGTVLGLIALIGGCIAYIMGRRKP